MANAGFDMVIFDEAHKLSKHGDGSESARYKVGQLLSEAVPVFILLTATPHQGDEDLFINLLRLIDPVLFADKGILTPSLVQEVTPTIRTLPAILQSILPVAVLYAI
jgi:superfamily II DNA or RNA helicase